MPEVAVRLVLLLAEDDAEWILYVGLTDRETGCVLEGVLTVTDGADVAEAEVE